MAPYGKTVKKHHCRIILSTHQNCVKGFFQELQSKRIYRVAGAYIVSAWVILQVTEIVFPSLELPGWSLKIVLGVLLLGFVPALSLGWHLDLRRARALRSSVLKKDIAWEMAVLAAGTAALLLLVAAGGWYILSGRLIKSAPAAHLSVVVLPFTNLSGDPSQDYFEDDVTENLTTDLSRIRNSFVIARNTAFTFKGKNVDSKEISRQLGVRYVLEGSVQRDQNRVRVNVQLVDGETGAHLWADRFEESITDLFKLQDQVVARLANSLGHELVKAEAQRSTHSTNPDAIDLTMRGWAALWQPVTNESITSAHDYFERALKLDPQYAEALVGLAYARLRASVYGWSKAAEDKPAAQMELLTKAIAISPGYAFA